MPALVGLAVIVAGAAIIWDEFSAGALVAVIAVWAVVVLAITFGSDHEDRALWVLVFTVWWVFTVYVLSRQNPIGPAIVLGATIAAVKALLEV